MHPLPPPLAPQPGARTGTTTAPATTEPSFEGEPARAAFQDIFAEGEARADAYSIFDDSTASGESDGPPPAGEETKVKPSATDDGAALAAVEEGPPKTSKPFAGQKERVAETPSEVPAEARSARPVAIPAEAPGAAQGSSPATQDRPPAGLLVAQQIVLQQATPARELPDVQLPVTSNAPVLSASSKAGNVINAADPVPVPKQAVLPSEVGSTGPQASFPDRWKTATPAQPTMVSADAPRAEPRAREPKNQPLQGANASRHGASAPQPTAPSCFAAGTGLAQTAAITKLPEAFAPEHQRAGPLPASTTVSAQASQSMPPKSQHQTAQESGPEVQPNNAPDGQTRPSRRLQAPASGSVRGAAPARVIAAPTDSTEAPPRSLRPIAKEDASLRPPAVDTGSRMSRQQSDSPLPPGSTAPGVPTPFASKPDGRIGAAVSRLSGRDEATAAPPPNSPLTSAAALPLSTASRQAPVLATQSTPRPSFLSSAALVDDGSNHLRLFATETAIPQSWEPQTGSSIPSTTNRPALPPQVALQIADVVRQMPNRPVEIALSPEELGRVRLSVATSESGIVVNVLAERPETLDLLRRHIDTLGQEFRDLGFEDVAFSFADGEGAAPGSGREADTANHGMAAADGPPEEALPPSVEHRAMPQLTGLDLRL